MVASTGFRMIVSLGKLVLQAIWTGGWILAAGASFLVASSSGNPILWVACGIITICAFVATWKTLC